MARAFMLLFMACAAVIVVSILAAVAADMVRLGVGWLGWVAFCAGVGAAIGYFGLMFGLVFAD